jgi:hypothetical protein
LLSQAAYGSEHVSAQWNSLTLYIAAVNVAWLL